jgi:hypothetical protein
MKLILVTCVVFCFYGPGSAKAQTLQAFRNHVIKALAEVDRIYDSTRSDQPHDKNVNYDDSLFSVNQHLKAYLTGTLPRIPIALTNPDPSIEGLNSVASSDHYLRVWSWDTRMGGSWPTIYSLVEFRTDGGIRTKVIKGRWYDTIFSIVANNQLRYYVPFLKSKYSTSDVGQSVFAWRLTPKSLETRVKLFRDSSLKSTLDIGYNYFRNYSYTGDERRKIELHVDTLLIPVVDDNDSLIDKNSTYIFDGEHFVYKGISKK